MSHKPNPRKENMVIENLMIDGKLISAKGTLTILSLSASKQASANREPKLRPNTRLPSIMAWVDEACSIKRLSPPTTPKNTCKEIGNV